MSARTAWVAIGAVTWLAAVWLSLLGGCGGAGTAGDAPTNGSSPTSATVPTTAGPATTTSAVDGLPSGTSLALRSGPPDDLVLEIRGLLGDSGVPIYLPASLPAGYEVSVPEDPAAGAGNPIGWSMGGARPGPRAAGYAVLYTDGVHRIRLDVNPAADLGDVQWAEAAVQGAYGPLRTTTAAGVMWVGVPDADGTEIVVSGNSTLAAALLALASEVTRVDAD